MNDYLRSEERAYISMVADRLALCQLYNWFADAENYGAWTLNAYAQRRSFPLNWWYPRKAKAEALERLRFAGFTADHEKEVYRVAQECIAALAAKIGDKSYFFGDKPSTVDAYIFGFLMTEVTAQLQNAKIAEHIRGHRNLVEYLNRIVDNFYDPRASRYQRPEINYKPLQALEEKKAAEQPKESADEATIRSHSTFFVLAGIAALIFYAANYNEQMQEFLERQSESVEAAGMYFDSS